MGCKESRTCISKSELRKSYASAPIDSSFTKASGESKAYWGQYVTSSDSLHHFTLPSHLSSGMPLSYDKKCCSEDEPVELKRSILLLSTFPFGMKLIPLVSPPTQTAHTGEKLTDDEVDALLSGVEDSQGQVNYEGK